MHVISLSTEITNKLVSNQLIISTTFTKRVTAPLRGAFRHCGKRRLSAVKLFNPVQRSSITKAQKTVKLVSPDIDSATTR